MIPSTPRGTNRGHFTRVGNQVADRRRARRLSRRFARVGVSTSPDQLRHLLAGSAAANAQVADFHFALIATAFRRDQLNAKMRRIKRRGTRSLLVVGMVLVTLNFLFCMAYAVFTLTLEAAPL